MEFLRKATVLHMHARGINQYGGLHGLRDDGGLESALMAAENRLYYEDASLAVCAATYTFHLCQAHAFLDGNKRIAATAFDAFLRLNGAYLDATNAEVIDLIFQIASSDMERTEVETFFVDRIRYYPS